MKAIEESGIVFEHDEKRCECIKFDDNIAYKRVDKKLKPTKGVDFIYIFDSKTIALVEVKNLKGHADDPKSKEKLNDGAEILTNQIAIKVRDSLACSLSAARFSTNDSEFWESFNKIFLDDNKPVIVIAWIEFDEVDHRKRKAKMSTWGEKLKQKLHWINSVQISVNNVENPPPINLNAKFST